TLERAEHRLELSREPRRSLFRGSVTQFCRDDDAAADLRLADPVDMFGRRAARMADQVGDDVGVEQVTRQSSTGSGGGSEIGGNSSSGGARVANSASRDFGGAGSMMSLSPSLRMIASSPGSSNSRGMRTAWFRPFLKSLTCRSDIIASSFHWLR